ncbi:MAG: DNA polymerase III subunit alpha, partial [Anaerobutyricum sp.]|nr:DNA polymerase III subunit alpha [Anaerobutyricum sp.]
KYGKDRVVQIVTFGTMAARGVIRDVARALDLPYAEADKIAKMIPKEPGITLHQALEMNPELSRLYETDETVRALLDMAVKLEGLPRNTSMHAAGVVISGRPVNEYVPLGRAQDGSITTQYTMTTLEELGLLKMDFLGLRTLTVIRNAESLVNASRGPEAARFDIDKIDYDDPAVMAMLGRGKCEGVFQLESAGMKAFMKELKPRVFEDIIAGIALYRPGPMDFIPRYIAGKTHPESVTYDCPEMKPILETTYGCIVYQEQVMQIVRDLGGYSMGRSDLVRRAMSKKKGDVMARERANFVYGNEQEGVEGCIKRGIPENVANHIFDEMIDFAKYAFNKSHAAAYAVVAYQTAWLRCYHPVEFMAALLTSVITNPKKITEYINTCRGMGIQILPPDINEGESGFSVSDGAIRYGLTAIKSLGKNVIDAMVTERNAHGPYKNLKDFMERLTTKEINKRTIENLIKSGALDSLGATRKQLMMVYAFVLDEVNRERKENISGQMSLFDFFSEEEKKEYEVQYPDVGEYDQAQKLAFEKEVMGIYVSGHPLEDYMDSMKKQITAKTTDFEPDEDTGHAIVKDGYHYIVGGMLSGVTVKLTKTNQNMAFLTLEDLFGTVEIILFPRDYQKYRDVLVADTPLYVKGRASVSEESGKLVAEEIIPMDQVPKEVWIQVENVGVFQEKQQALYDIIRQHSGERGLVVYSRKDKAIKRLPSYQNISGDSGVIRDLKQLFGEKNIKVTEKSIEKFQKKR